jgi:hypothetical protein
MPCVTETVPSRVFWRLLLARQSAKQVLLLGAEINHLRARLSDNDCKLAREQTIAQ